MVGFDESDLECVGVVTRVLWPTIVNVHHTMGTKFLNFFSSFPMNKMSALESF